MTAHVAYSALDASGTPATFSPAILQSLRSTLGFDGLVVTDALIMEGATVGRRESDAAVDAIRAGADILLYPNDARRVSEAIDQALAGGTLPPARVHDALTRYERALAQATAPTPPVTRGPFDSADALADALLDRGMIRGAAPVLDGPIDLVVIDDDLGGPYPPGPSDIVSKELGRNAGDRYGGGPKVVLVFSEPRAWKGRAGLGPAAQQSLMAAAPDTSLIVLFGHPRLKAELPTDAPVLLAWHRQRLMQRAVARWLQQKLRT